MSAPEPAAPQSPAEGPRATILYDADCGFCRWSLAKLLAWDRRRVLRPLALQDPGADVLLGGMDEERKMASWHLVTADGGIASAGAALPPLLRLLPGGRPLAALAARMPRTTERAYDWVAGHRTLVGRPIGQGARRRATKRIEERS
jgi:predicted DCC family thiol-disulfide oxidoreductase YuxK